MKLSVLKKKQSQLDAIAKKIENCEICKQGKIGKAVPGEGNADADIVFIGEAPGKQEAASGRPFIGRSGKLLRSLINEVGLKEENVFITSPVKYLPEYITPTLEDIEHGRTHLFEQFAVIQPKVVVLLGNTAVKAVLEDFDFDQSYSKSYGSTSLSPMRRHLSLPGEKGNSKSKNVFSIAKDRGKVIKRDGITYLITYHPAAPLYNPNVKKDLVKDFKKLRKIIND